MSADNWTTCPECSAKEKAKREAAAKRASEAYGKVSIEKHRELCEAAQQQKPLDSTLREDYELGVDDDGVFRIDYHCSCNKCGFVWTCKREEKIAITR
jgi:hypothetical protein